MWITRLRAQLVSPSYPDVDLRFSTVNVFLGPNNSGKSRLLFLLNQLAIIETSPAGSHPGRPNIDQLATGVQLDQDEHLTRPEAGLLPFRYLPVDRTPPSGLDTRRLEETREQPRQSGTGVGDILTELHEMPLLRPVLQVEIERLFGVSFAFESRGFNLNWYADDGSSSGDLTLGHHGRGIQYYVALFFYLYHPDVRVLLVDEPENSLHPQLQRALIGRIRAIAREQGKQVFLATHSPILALPRTADDLDGVYLLQRYFQPRPRILSLSSLVPSVPEERRRFESFLPNLDPAIAELFFARGALLVEGQTERQFLRYLASRTGRDPDESGATIVESNGLGLMPGLIRLARSPLQHWRALADGDLLSRTGQQFDGYRKDFEAAFGRPVPVAKRASAEFLAAQESLRPQGLWVLSKLGLEDHYLSPPAAAYRAAHGAVAPEDKGWLLSEEIAFLADKDAGFVDASYSDLLAPMDSLLQEMQSTGFAPRPTHRLIGDILFSDAESTHRQAYHGRWSEERLRTFLSTSRGLKAYELQYGSFDKYELRWTDALAGRYRIRCDGVWFHVEFAARAADPYLTLRRGTVAQETPPATG